MKKCQICGSTENVLKAKNQLNDKEWKKFLKLKKKQSICSSCKTEYLYYNLF